MNDNKEFTLAKTGAGATKGATGLIKKSARPLHIPDLDAVDCNIGNKLEYCLNVARAGNLPIYAISHVQKGWKILESNLTSHSISLKSSVI